MNQSLANLIDGQLQPALCGATLAVYAPATGEVYGAVPRSGPADVDAAVAAATRAGPAWAALANDERARWLEAIADAIEADCDGFAHAESHDTGKPITLARTVDIPRAIANFRFFAAAARTYGSEYYSQPDAWHIVLRKPIGVVGLIAPWNLPLYLLSWKIAPALAFGCTAVAKPSELTPLTADRLASICVALKLPAGVLNIVHGTGAEVGEALVGHRAVAGISFTGSTAVGARIAGIAAPQFKKLSLELGGKNPTIVFARSRWREQLPTLVRSAFSNQGQICLCGSRLLIERNVMAEFRQAFVDQVRALRIGDPADPGTEFGALSSRAHLERVINAIAAAETEGGRVLCGGARLQLPGPLAGGYYVAPTVIDQLPQHCPTNQNEIFGPVVTLDSFDDESEALLKASNSGYGLAASVYTDELAQARRCAQQLRAGLVWVNGWMRRDLRLPFGGWGQSGVGREGGIDAYRFYTDTTSLSLVDTP